jgi:hypothetical protein
MNYQGGNTCRPNALKIVGFVIGGIVLAVLFAFIFGYFVMLLWNWLMPAIFGLGEINYWMAFGLIVLGRLIFGNFGPGHHKNDDGKKAYSRNCFGRDKINKWKNMRNWHHYDDFWEEEGEKAYENYLERKSENNERADNA